MFRQIVFWDPTLVGCGDWVTVSMGSSYCDPDDGCGFLGLKETNKADYWVARNCMWSDNTPSTQMERREVDLGCCQ